MAGTVNRQSYQTSIFWTFFLKLTGKMIPDPKMSIYCLNTMISELD